MKICVIGTGYVGLVVGACMADMGNNVICVDKDKTKLDKLRSGIVPIFEPGLEELIKLNVEESRLSFTDDLKSAVEESVVCFIAVGTPCKEDGSADLSAVFEVAREIGSAINGYKVIVDKSTVPVGTADKVYDIIKSLTKHDFDVVSNPEFLKQGGAVEDFLRPDRVVIGSDSARATKIMQELYAPHTLNNNPIFVMDVKSAEMTKYASNSFLAMKISFANEIANICEKVGADVQSVRAGMCADKRIGSKFLFPGLGFGGSCFPKDVKALINIANNSGYTPRMLKSAYDINVDQRKLFINKILNKFDNNIKGLTFAVWGLAFKPNTNDMREAPSIDIINALLEMGAVVRAFDPKATETAKMIFGDKITYAKNCYDALTGADALLLLTEWHEFRMPDFNKISTLLNKKIIFDGRNQYDKTVLSGLGFDYISIGRC